MPAAVSAQKNFYCGSATIYSFQPVPSTIHDAKIVQYKIAEKPVPMSRQVWENYTFRLVSKEEIPSEWHATDPQQIEAMAHRMGVPADKIGQVVTFEMPQCRMTEAYQAFTVNATRTMPQEEAMKYISVSIHNTEQWISHHQHAGLQRLLTSMQVHGHPPLSQMARLYYIRRE